MVISQVVFFAICRANRAPKMVIIRAQSFMVVGIVVGVGFVGSRVVTRIRPVKRLPIARRIRGLVRVGGSSFMVDVVVRGVLS